MAIKILPYNMNSESAGLLAAELNTTMIVNDPNRSRYVPRHEHMIINWGTVNPWVNPNRVGFFVNLGEEVNSVSNKLKFFRNYNGKFNHPAWTEDRAVAWNWIINGYDVVVRHEIAGMGGEGIEIIRLNEDNVNNPDRVPRAPLYTRYIPKAAEYRVHVFNGKMVDIQQKVKRAGVEGNFQIRTHDNGFVFARTVNDRPVAETAPVQVINEACLAVDACLDFGGVDVIYNRAQNKAYVLEINSAPGIEGTTVKSYAKAFKDFHDAVML